MWPLRVFFLPASLWGLRSKSIPKRLGGNCIIFYGMTSLLLVSHIHLDSRGGNVNAVSRWKESQGPIVRVRGMGDLIIILENSLPHFLSIVLPFLSLPSSCPVLPPPLLVFFSHFPKPFHVKPF